MNDIQYNQNRINEWLSEHHTFVSYVSPTHMSTEPIIDGYLFFYECKSRFYYESYSGNRIEKDLRFTLQFEFERVSLRKVVLMWRDGKNSAAADFTHWGSSYCLKWIRGLLITRYGKSVVWPLEDEQDQIPD